MAQGDTNQKQGLFLHKQNIHLHNENTRTKLQTAFDENIMENNSMFVILLNLKVAIYKNKLFDGGSLKRLRSLLSYF